MSRCFVIQPFDAGKFDKRYDQVYKPAIEAAGLEAYRVDRDPGVEVPIDAIEEGIRSASICLADITTDNPNVWYELGYAFASGRAVVMVCSEERANRRYPFDIQHRTVIPYLAEAPGDFDALLGDLTSRIKALLQKGEAFRSIAETEQVAPVEGLSQPELFVLASIAGNASSIEGTTSLHYVKTEVEQAGLTNMGFSLGLRRLRQKGFVALSKDTDYNGEPYDMLCLTEVAWSWIEANEALFVLQRPKQSKNRGDEAPF